MSMYDPENRPDGAPDSLSAPPGDRPADTAVFDGQFSGRYAAPAAGADAYTNPAADGDPFAGRYTAPDADVNAGAYADAEPDTGQAQGRAGQDAAADFAPPAGQDAYAGGGADSPRTPPVKGGGNKGLLIGIGGLVIVAAVAGFLLLSGRSADPKAYVAEAYGNTKDAVAGELSRQAGLADLRKLLQLAETAPTKQTLRLGLAGDSSFLGALGLAFDAEADAKARKAKLNAAVTMAGTPLADLDIGLDQDLLSFSSPLFFEGAYGFDLSTLGRDFNASALSAYLGQTLDENLSLPLWPDGEAGAGTSAAPAWVTAAFGQFWETAAVEESEEQEVPINVLTHRCEVFELTAGQETVRTCLRALWEGLQNDDRLWAYLTYQGAAYGYTPEDMRQELEAALQTLLDSISGDLRGQLYVYQERLIRADFLLPMAQGGGRNLRLTVQLGGEQNLLDAFTLTVGDADEGLVLNWSGRHLPSDGQYDTELTVYAESGGVSTLLFTMTGWYDANLAADNVSLLLDLVPDSADAMRLSLRGSLSYDNSQKTLTADFPEIAILAPGMAEQRFIGSYDLSPLTGAEFPAVNPTLLFDLSEQEIEALLAEIEGNFMRFFSMGGLL